MSDKTYTYEGSGINRKVSSIRFALSPSPIRVGTDSSAQGNHWCSRNYGSYYVPNQNSYHYANLYDQTYTHPCLALPWFHC